MPAHGETCHDGMPSLGLGISDNATGREGGGAGWYDPLPVAKLYASQSLTKKKRRIALDDARDCAWVFFS